MKESLVYASNDFSNEEIDYILIRLFEETNNINMLSLSKMFDIFTVNAWKSMNERSKKSLIFKEGQVSYILDFKMDDTESDQDDNPIISFASNAFHTNPHSKSVLPNFNYGYQSSKSALTPHHAV